MFSSLFYCGHVPLCHQKLVLSTLLASVTIKLRCPATNTRVPNNKDCHTLLVLTEARGYGSGSIWSPSVLWHMYGEFHSAKSHLFWHCHIYVSACNSKIKLKKLEVLKGFPGNGIIGIPLTAWGIPSIIFSINIQVLVLIVLSIYFCIIFLPINCYTGNSTTKCHTRSMSDNRDLTGVFHQKISLVLVSIASDSRSFQTSWICSSVTKYSTLQLPVKAVYI